MIIECINCNKKFNVDDHLIPDNGREIICGSCNYAWHFKLEKTDGTSPVPDNDNIDQQKQNKKKDDVFLENFPKIKPLKNFKKDETKINLRINNKNTYQKTSKFLSYLLVFIISFIALIILVDTIKLPLINIFPSLEIVLFNLFETLKDVKLFIIDLI